MRPYALLVAVAVLARGSLEGQQQPTALAQPRQESEGAFRFRSGIELVNVTATVTDANGRFVSGLRKDDFAVYEDDQLQEVTQFSADRVPVSLGIALDASQSMSGEKIQSAKSALNRFLFDLSGTEDEFFLYRFSDVPALLQGWASDRGAVSRSLGRVIPGGRTALYDAVADAVPLAQTGRNVKKALVVISDGNDTSSRTSLYEVRQLIRENEALVYAIGIDCGSERISHGPQFQRPPFPVPFPPGRGWWPPQPPRRLPPSGREWQRGCADPVDAAVLRAMTDDSGGRTAVIRTVRDLDPATSAVADELSKQYYLGYPAAGKKDGQWHSIRVEVRKGAYRVRARRGYTAS